MKRVCGNVLIALGSLCILAALGFFLYNGWTAQQAEQFSQQAVPALVENIAERRRQQEASDAPALPEAGQETPAAPVLPAPQPEMETVEFDGSRYIGVLSIPALELELPIMDNWTPEKLRVSPCRYTGSVYGEDLVLMAHNYKRHFGRFQQLKPEDTVCFLDADGVRWEYKVSVVDVLAPTAVEEMTSGEWPLTLFTCSYGGKSRVTVRCDAVSSVYSAQDFQ